MRRLVAIAFSGICLVLAAGCDGDGGTPPPTETTDGTGAPQALAIYLIQDGKVAPVRRTLDDAGADPIQSSLELLFAGPTSAERSDGYTTSLRTGGPDALSVADGTATTELPAGESPSDLATAQLVHTLTQFPDVKRVVVEGDDSSAKPLTRKAFEAEAPQILIESPLEGDAVSSPIRLRGTANVFEATVSLEVRDETGTVILEAFTTATSGTGTRGTFDTELVLPGATGTMTIVAFESSAKDGSRLHVADVQVSLRR